MPPPTFDGLLVLDKPGGITSRDAVDRALGWFPSGTRLGHAGTLDPLATGVLVLAVGAATRLVEYVQRMDKVYVSTFRLGATSDTDDADGAITERATDGPPLAAVESALAGFVGDVGQVPPAYSAVHVGGRRAHALARKGRVVELEARTVTIHAIDVVRYEFPWLEVEVRCGKGTYIRSLARDVGERLGVGGLVQILRRTRIGPFRAEAGLTLEAGAEAARAALLPPRAALAELPVVTLTDADARRLRQGQRLGPLDVAEGEVVVVDGAGRLVAVAEAAAGVVRPVKVWPAGQN